MFNLLNINKESSKEEILKELLKKFNHLLGSDGNSSYMNMYADDFRQGLVTQTRFSEYDIYNILNEACDISWKNQVKG
ncbi:hypothetical protein [Labilibaculum sp.]|uniref:hypothetical protein n=1 Tax=Labilibaculum sp. TaxID=2060723 RepID=UPI003566EC6A